MAARRAAATDKEDAPKTSAKKAPAKKPVAKKPAAKTTAKTTAKKAPAKKTQAKKPTAKTTTTRAATLRTDLKKHATETYATGELLRGALIVVEREGADAIRTAVMALLASKVPLAGNALSKQAVDSLVRILTDDYKKLNSDDKKAVRGVLNWLSGAFEVDTGARTQLVAALSATASTPVSPAAISAPAAEPALTGLAQGFVLPPKP